MRQKIARIWGIIRKYAKYIWIGICLLAVLFLELWHNDYVSQLASQQIVDRWGGEEQYVQLSCFFPEGAGMSLQQIKGMEYNLMKIVQDGGVVPEKANARALVDAYSMETTLQISSPNSTGEVRGYGVSKDFFLFHPMELIDGTDLTKADEAEDGVILDENVAWMLFGATHVSGMHVILGDTSYVIRGVVRADSGSYSKTAGEETPSVYMELRWRESMQEKSWWKTMKFL